MRFLFLMLALAGCPDRTISKVVPQEGRVEYNNFAVMPNRDLDLLFLIDDSPSMADKQNNLRMNFPSFINVLNTIEGGLPNIHLGVATSDLGSKGADDAQPGPAISGCSGNGKAGNLQTSGSTSLQAGAVFISDIKDSSGARQTNYSGALADTFSQIAKVGTAGCGFEQHLEAIKRALDNNPANAGFLRPNAYLGVIILGDEDDCSMAHSSLIGPDTSSLGPLQSFRCTRFGVTCDQGGADPTAMNQVGPKGSCHSNESKTYLTDVQRYVDFLKGLKTDASQVIVADIGGPPTPVETELRAPPGGGSPIPALAHSCTYNPSATDIEVADPTVRVTQFLSGFPKFNTYSTICQQDLSGAMTQIAQLLAAALGSSCIDGNLVVPYDCSVSDVTNFGKPSQMEHDLPACNNTQTPASSTNKPCWAIESDPVNCMTATTLAVKVERDVAPAPDTRVISYCVTQ